MVVMTIKREDIQALAGRVNSRLPKVAISLRGGADLERCAKSGDSPCMIAVANGLAECHDFLIGKRVGLDKKKLDVETAAFQAARARHLDCLKMLARAGADLDAIDHDRQSAATESAANHNLECLEFLTTSGASLNAFGRRDESAAEAAATTGNMDSLAVLTAHGVDRSLSCNAMAQIAAIHQGHFDCAAFVSAQIQLLGINESVSLGKFPSKAGSRV